jgi:hypothetical protein
VRRLHFAGRPTRESGAVAGVDIIGGERQGTNLATDTWQGFKVKSNDSENGNGLC